MAVINIRIIEEDGIVVVRGLEFPNVIVQGKTVEEAKKEFAKALECFFATRAKIENEKYPLLHKEKAETMRMELVENE